MSITNTHKHAILLCLMVLYSTFSYATHAAGMDITYECVGGSSSSSGVQVTVTINTDLYGNEITWTITNSSGVVVANGGPYAFGVNTYIVTVCVPTGTLNFNWYDSYGDGWNWGGIQGSYSVTQGGATLTSGSPSWGSSGSSTFYVSGGTPCTTSSSSQYLITVKFYRDCDGISAPGSMTLNYSSASCGQSGNTTLSQTSGGQEITPICPGYTTTCQNSFAIITGIQEYTYQATITLPAQCADWVLSVCECCRNNAITTINNPGGQELCVEAMINNSIGITPCNNSPTFSIPPVPFICNGMTYCYNNGATDIDGDSLVYTLVTPLSNNSGGIVSYNGSYSVNNPAGGTTMFDPLTGNLCLTTTSNLVTVIAIRVDEYRNGVLIGSVIRDVQVNVINCSNNTPVLSGFGGSPTNVNSNPASATYTFCADEITPINLTIDGSDPNSSNNLNMTWNQSIPGATFNITGNNTNSPVGTFSWIPSSSNASSIPYYFTVSVTDDACPINASYSYSYSIIIDGNPDAGISNNISVCETDPPFNLFSQLGGSPTGGGTWYDSNSNIATNNFDPSIQGSNVFTYVLDSAGSCPGDSATIIVTVNSAAPHLHIAAICYGDSIFLQNVWQTQAGIYLDTFLTATCDSIIQTTLSVNILPVVTPNFVVNGNTIIQPGPIYQLTQPLGNQAGSVWNSSLLDLNFPFDFEVELFFGCNNAGADGMAFVLQQVSSTIGSSGGGIGYLGISPSFGVEFDTWQNSSDPTHDHLAIQRNGDLNHNGINNLFGPIGFPPGNLNIEDCNWHDVRFIWDPSINLFIVNFDGVQLVNYTVDIINTCFSGNSNVYWGFTAATGGANNLQQFKFKNYNLLDNTICRGDTIQINSLITNSSLSYLWLPNSGIDNNISSAPFFSPNTTTTYTLEVINSYGCSFIDTFNIYVDTVDITGITNTSVSCNGGSNGQAMVLLGGNSSFYSYQWNDINNQTTQIAYNLTAGNYNCIVTNDNYCTDTANVTIFEPPPISSVDIQIHCDSYTWIDGINYTASNNSATYIIPNGNINGCDSTITLDLTINYLSSSTDVQQACDSYTWIDGITYTASNNSATYIIPNGNINGCDSIITLDLIINNSTTSTDVQQACHSYTWVDGITYTASNNSATFLYQTINGCDSLVTLDLTINYSSSSTDVQQACGSYTWVDGITYTASNNSATFLYQTINGCDSLVTLDLTINYSSSSTDTQQACDSYTWIDGINYTASNNSATYIIPNGNINGCDSIITLDLTINYFSSSTDIQQACDSYTWIDGITYTASNNSATYIIPNGNINGCDSIITLDLTINNSTTSTDVQQACHSYTWVDGITYTASNNSATFLYQTINGCDSLVTLDLTINYSSSSTNTQQACDSYTWVDGITYIASNNSATFLYQTINGCDSLVTLDLTLNPLPTAIISGTDTICIGEFSDLSFILTGLTPFNVDYTDGTNSFTVSLDINGNNASSGLPISHYPLINTSYSIISITDANGCSNTGSGIADKIVNPLPNITINGSVGICLGDSTDLAFSVWNGTAPFNVTLNDGTVNSYWLMDNNGTVNGLPVTVSPNTSTTYSLVEVTDENGCWNELNGNATIIVHDLPTALISGTTTLCEDEFTPITFTLQNGLSPYNVNYNINGVATSNSFSNSGINTIMVSPSTTTVYSLVDIMDANNCFNTASDSATIDVNEKVNVTINGGGDICNDGSQVTIDIITNDSTFINVTYTNGFNPITLSGVGPFEIITNQAGIYMITDVVDIYGCVGTYSGNATITVNPLPLAEFSFFPQPTDLDNPHINFTNASFGHTTAIWDFGDGTILNDTISKLLHTYNDTGHYKVNLAISNPFGCTDTISYTIIIDPIFTIYIPDAFTPNGDNINDAFGPSVYGIKEFEMKIYDRWGKIIYHTTEKDKPWDGTINNNETQAGVYTYSIVATDLKEKPHKYVGAFILFR